MIDVDKAAYPTAIEALKDEQSLSQTVALRQNKYLNKRDWAKPSKREADCQASDGI